LQQIGRLAGLCGGMLPAAQAWSPQQQEDLMKHLIVGTVSVAVLIAVPHIALAQAKTVSSEVRVETGVIEAIDATTRKVTIKKADGTVVTTVAGPEITRFSEVKVGDTITARYYDTVVIRVKRPGEAEVASATRGTAGSEQALPGGTKAKQLTLTVTITGIDPAVPSITFTGPEGWKYTSKVQDTAALATVKVGDKVDIVWTEALLVALERK
jgi:Cu/Ag efflux protein CusF